MEMALGSLIDYRTIAFPRHTPTYTHNLVSSCRPFSSVVIFPYSLASQSSKACLLTACNGIIVLVHRPCPAVCCMRVQKANDAKLGGDLGLQLRLISGSYGELWR